MKILFTGGSSFTGFWFIRELARAGHEVVATFRRKADEYPDAVRQQRVKLAGESCRAVFGASFGDDAFLKLIRESGPFDLLCHHAADVTNYKSPDFDVPAALATSRTRLRMNLEKLAGNPVTVGQTPSSQRAILPSRVMAE
jgi:nucleoside-diphosphate-sugar epimerase